MLLEHIGRASAGERLPMSVVATSDCCGVPLASTGFRFRPTQSAMSEPRSIVSLPANGIAGAEWEQAIAPDWNGASRGDLAALFDDLDPLTLQEDEKQNVFKLSYYAPEDISRADLLCGNGSAPAQPGRARKPHLECRRSRGYGPAGRTAGGATKLHAVRFLCVIAALANNTRCSQETVATTCRY